MRAFSDIIILPVLYILLPLGIVDEGYSVRVFPADCPIPKIFKHSHLSLFQLYVVVFETLRSFQQLNAFIVGRLHFHQLARFVLV